MNISNTNCCLILAVDGENCLNNTVQEMGRDYEQESINCIGYWRERAGWLKHIPIIVHSPANPIKQETIEEYERLGVTYIHHQMEMVDHGYGFYNVHYSGKYMEEILPEKYKYTIHIDLDMELLREIPKSLFETDAKVLVGGYNKEDYEVQRKPLHKKDGVPIITNTDFIVCDRGFGFYHKIVELMENFDYSVIDREYDMEEYCSDELVSLYDEIQPVIGYEQGEGYHYQYTHDNCYFWHEHIGSKTDYKLKLHKHKVISWISKTITTS